MSDEASPSLGVPGPLSAGEVHVWCVSLECPPERLAALSALLSTDEKARAERFYFERDRDRYVAGRGFLRTLLGGYLGEQPARLEFSYGEHGKPALARAGQGKSLEFNLSHSGSLAVFAFSWARRLGIDLEHVRPMPDEDSFADRFFSPDESALVRSLSGERKLAAFFTIWTCKEAVLKADGDGLVKPLNQTEVRLADGAPVRLVAVDGDAAQAARWRLQTFTPAPGFLAALVAEAGDWEMMTIQLGN